MFMFITTINNLQLNLKPKYAKKTIIIMTNKEEGERF